MIQAFVQKLRALFKIGACSDVQISTEENQTVGRISDERFQAAKARALKRQAKTIEELSN